MVNISFATFHTVVKEVNQQEALKMRWAKVGVVVDFSKSQGSLGWIAISPSLQPGIRLENNTFIGLLFACSGSRSLAEEVAELSLILGPF